LSVTATILESAENPVRAMKPHRALKAMTASDQTPVLAEAILVSSLCALLRRSLSDRRPTALDPKETFVADNGTPRIEVKRSSKARQRTRWSGP
jgi:hypothetical protein